MARTRAQRRRQTLLLTCALAVTLLALLFARDVSRAAHNAIGPRRSENRTFAALANNLIGRENQFDAHLAYLLSHGQTLDRVVFAARLAQLNQELPDWSIEADQLRRPKIAHDLNDVIATSTELRVDAYQQLLASVARSLTLPWPALASTSPVLADPAGTIITSSQQWSTMRTLLVHEPGIVRLDALSALSATYEASVGLVHLTSSPTLALIRGIGIASVAVTPAPLPSSAGTLLMPPVGFVHVGVTVRNASYVVQPVALRVTLTPAGGAAQSQTFSITLGPLRSYAFTAKLFTVRPGEHATLTLSLGGAPAAAGMRRSETYQVRMSPTGTG